MNMGFTFLDTSSWMRSRRSWAVYAVDQLYIVQSDRWSGRRRDTRDDGAVQCMHTYISINSLNPSSTHHPLTNPLIITLFYIHPTKGPKHKKKIPMYPKHPRSKKEESSATPTHPSPRPHSPPPHSHFHSPQNPTPHSHSHSRSSSSSPRPAPASPRGSSC